MTTLKDKSVLIVGGTSGIGYGVAEACLKEQASKVIVVSSSAERVKKTVERLREGKFGNGDIKGEFIDAKDPVALKEFIINIGEIDHVIWTSGDDVTEVMGFPNVALGNAKGQ